VAAGSGGPQAGQVTGSYVLSHAGHRLMLTVGTAGPAGAVPDGGAREVALDVDGRPAPGRRRRPDRVPFEPPAGTRAQRLYRFQVEHPRLYAARHVVVAVTQDALAVLGLRLAIDLVPWGAIPWPDLPSIRRVDLPSVPWPDLPDLPRPDWALPGWLVAVLGSRRYWLPILVAVGVAVGEIRRRAARDRAAKEQQDDRVDEARRRTPPDGTDD